MLCQRLPLGWGVRGVSTPLLSLLLPSLLSGLRLRLGLCLAWQVSKGPEGQPVAHVSSLSLSSQAQEAALNHPLVRKESSPSKAVAGLVSDWPKTHLFPPVLRAMSVALPSLAVGLARAVPPQRMWPGFGALLSAQAQAGLCCPLFLCPLFSHAELQER